MKIRIFLALAVVLALLALPLAAPATADPPLPDAAAWQALPLPPGGSVTALAVSPAFAVDRTLLAGSNNGVYLSRDAGASWMTLSIAIAPTRLIVSPDYPIDPTVFAITDATREWYDVLYRSADGGVTWLPVWYGGDVYDLALSPSFAEDGIAFLAVSLSPGQVLHSSDFGATWQALSDPVNLQPVLHLAVSPAFAADHTLFAAGFGPLNRSTDGGASWQPLSAAAPTYSLAISPHYATDRTLWAVYREIEASAAQPETGVIRSTDGGNTWRNVTAGLDGNYNEHYRSLTTDPTGQAVYLALTAPQWDPRFPPRVYRSDNDGQRWSPQELLPGGAAPSQVLAAGPLPDLFVLAEGTIYRYTSLCYQALADGGFETGPELLPYPQIARAWETPSTPLPAGYAEDIRHSGAYAMRTGTGPNGPNVYSYSSARQWVSLPNHAAGATLTFWRYPTLGDVTEGGQDAVSKAGLLATGPEVNDFQYLLAVFADGSFDTLHTWRDNSQTWTLTEVDLSAYAGRSFFLHFGVFNNGVGGRSGLVIDDAALRLCLPTPSQPIHQYLPLIVRNQAVSGG